jgi:hypothetical protein
MPLLGFEFRHSPQTCAVLRQFLLMHFWKAFVLACFGINEGVPALPSHLAAVLESAQNFPQFIGREQACRSGK